MNVLICSAADCKQPFEPAFGQEETQKFCSVRCRNRDGVRRYRERHRQKPNGGGPGGKRQAMLFSRSELHRRKTAKLPRPKPGDLFPEDGQAIHATFGGAAEVAQDGSMTDNGRYSKYSVKLPIQPRPARHSVTPEVPVAA